MTATKRCFDLCVAALLSLTLAPLILLISLSILLLDGRPIFYIGERMKTPTEAFGLIKFRTMKPMRDDSGVSGGDKIERITATGAFLRGKRLDELPQIWNIILGDISFVGPRPPLRQYVERFPELYERVLRSRPGVTGLASVYFHKHEEHLLSRSITRAQTDDIYCRLCIPRKAYLDLIYQQKSGICLDISIMLKTVFKSLR